MFGYIFKLMWRRRERLVLVMLGILLVSFAAGIAASTARTTQGTVDEELARRWVTDYDLLIRHPSALGEMELAHSLISANYQTNTGATLQGITEEQLEIIRRIPGVEVAAPLTIVGLADSFSGWAPELPELEPGIYRITHTFYDTDGISEFSKTVTTHLATGYPYDSHAPEGFDWSQFPGLFGDNRRIHWLGSVLRRSGLVIEADLHYGVMALPMYYLVAAIDPEAEAKLVGLDQAVIDGEYLIGPSYSQQYEDEDGEYRINALYNAKYPKTFQAEMIVELVDVPLSYATILSAYDSDSPMYFFEQAATEVYQHREESATIVNNVGRTAAGFYAQPGSGIVYSVIDNDLVVYSSDLSVHNPYGIEWSPQTTNTGAIRLFRSTGVVEDERPPSERRHLLFNITGVLDPDKLDLVSDSLTSVPLALYDYELPELVNRGDGSVLPGPVRLEPGHSLGYSGVPIGLLVDKQAADLVRGYKASWDSVRVRVSEVKDMSEQSQVRIAAVAQQIRDATGLHVDIVLGCSRKQMPVQLYDYDSEARQQYRAAVIQAMEEIIPKIEAATGHQVLWNFSSHPQNNEPFYGLSSRYGELCTEEWGYYRNDMHLTLAPLLMELAGNISGVRGFVYKGDSSSTDAPRGAIYIEVPDYEIGADESRPLYAVLNEYWVQLGTHLRIYHETNRGTFWVTIALLLVSGLFIGNTTYISALGRTGEFSALRSLGWRRSTVFRVALQETVTIAILAGLVTGGVLSLVWLFSDRYLEPWLLLIVAPIVFLTFILGGLPPLLKTLAIQPLQGVRSGELKTSKAAGSARPLGFVLRGLLSRPGRTAVTVFALAVPGCALAFMVHVYFGIQKVLGETMLGEYLALELQGYHFLLNALIFAVAGLAVTDTLLINLRERQKEFSLLKALGWKDGTVASLLFWEGVGLGLLGGILGAVVSLAAYKYIFTFLPVNPVLNTALLALVPGVAGGLASLVPVIKARKLPVAQVLREE